MAYQIKRVQGKPHKETDDEVVMNADEKYIFEIHDLHNNQGITWTLKDKAKSVLFTKKCKPEEKLILSINKNLSGNYCYYLGACTFTGFLDSIKISGFCPIKIANSSWMSAGKKNAALRSGDVFEIKMEAEGMNGNIAEVEIYSRHKNRFIIKKTIECREGYISVTINKNETINWPSTIFKVPEKIPEVTELYIKVKHNNLYIKNSRGLDEILKLNFKTQPLFVYSSPINQTPLSVKTGSQKAKEIDNLISGIVELEKIKILDTTLSKTHVCNDHINNWSNKYPDLWILNSVTDPYHWLKTRTGDDLKKPDPLPVTFSRNKNFNFQASFKCLFPFDKIYIQVKDKDKKCVFADKLSTAKSKNDTFTLTFNTTSAPYKTIRYIDNFELSFYYSLDNQTWTLFKKVIFCLYITWNIPNYNKLQDLTLFVQNNPKYSAKTPAEKTSIINATTLKITQGTGINARSFICESLLYLGCQNADNINISSSNKTIALKIFEIFKDPLLRILRKREIMNVKPNSTEKYLPNTNPFFGLGYWRDDSDHPDRKSSYSSGLRYTTPLQLDYYYKRSVRYLLAYGVGRCQEFADFMSQLLLTQGLGETKNGSISIWTDIAGGRGKRSSHTSTDSCSVNFAVKDARHDDVTNPMYISNNSKAQGNYDAQPTFSDHIWFLYNNSIFLDPSYGMEFDTTNSNIKEYCVKCLNSIYVKKELSKSRQRTVIQPTKGAIFSLTVLRNQHGSPPTVVTHATSATPSAPAKGEIRNEIEFEVEDNGTNFKYTPIEKKYEDQVMYNNIHDYISSDKNKF